MRPRMRSDGLYSYVAARDGDTGEWVRIADHFDMPARVSDPRTGGAYGLRVEFTDERERAKNIVIPATALHGSARDICSTLSDLGLYIDREYQGALVDHLQGQMKSAPSADLATAPGWLTPSLYVLPDNVFGEQENGRAVYFGGDMGAHDYRARGTLAEWQCEVAQPCVGNSRLVLAVSAALAGPLMADAGESSGGVHFYGGTSIGKTTALAAGGSVCGGGDRRTGFISSWRTTSNGLEPLLAGHNDGAVFLDEIAQADARGIGELVYCAANNSGRNRMNRELRAATILHWRVLIVSSGEHTITAHARRAGITLPGGAAVRIIDIPADAGKGLGLFENLHGSKSPGVFADRVRSAALAHYGVALREFLRSVTLISREDRRAIVRDYRAQFIAACKLADAGPEVLRAGNRMSLIAAAGELGIELDILPWPVGAAIDGVAACFHAWRDSRGGDMVAHDDARAVEQVRLFIERYGESRFERLPGRVGLSESDRRPVIDRAGWRRHDGKVLEYLVQPEYFRAEVCKGFDAAAVARALHTAGFLRRQGRHWTIRTTLSGVGKREVYCVTDALLAGRSEVA